MKSSFETLMALSKTQTKETQNAVQEALMQRQQKELLRRKQQAEQEAKEQELARKIRLQHFENERKERERQQRLQEERQAQDVVLKKRQEANKNNILYGPKKTKALSSNNTTTNTPDWPSSSAHDRAKADVRKQRVPDEANREALPSEFMTREEKRNRRQELELRRLYRSPTKRSSNSNYSRKSRLPGGAVDVLTSSRPSDSAVNASNKSVKERIAAMPNTLTKLNTIKRDVRTIDEILQDRAKAREVKTLDGDKARVFDDWFGSSKKKDRDVAKPRSPSQHRSVASAAPSGTNTPASQGSNTGSPTPATMTKKSLVPKSSSLVKSGISKNNSSSTKPVTSSRSAPSNTPLSVKPLKAVASVGSLQARKHARSSSFSDTCPPQKRRHEEVDYRSEIWKLFNRDRDAYVTQDVFSDDEDMEADALVLEREERESARIAKREDDLALAEERRREEEKRRRKKQMMRDRCD